MPFFLLPFRQEMLIFFLGASIAADMLAHAFEMTNKDCINKIWKDEWEIFYTSNMVSAVVSWDYDLIKHIGHKCKVLKNYCSF